jgi:hypothetical protein
VRLTATHGVMDFDVDAMQRKLAERAEISRAAAAAGPTPTPNSKVSASPVNGGIGTGTGRAWRMLLATS